jgi:hypothetical protein
VPHGIGKPGKFGIVGGLLHGPIIPRMGTRQDGLHTAILCGLCSLLLVAGCKSLSDNPSGAKPPNQLVAIFGNERLKADIYSASPIDASSGVAVADGMWFPDDPAKTRVFAEQVEISCTKQDGICTELTLPLGVTKDAVHLMAPERTLWPLKTWGANGITALYGPDSTARLGSWDRCLRHEMTMTFSTGTVSKVDIPTHEKGCEGFKEIESSRLVYGNYYVDTTPSNDADKPHSAN